MSGTLVVHPGALGDVLLAIPALRTLERAQPDDRLTLAAQPRIGDLLRALEVVDAAVDFDSLGLNVLFTDDPPASRLRAVTDAARVVCWFGAKDPHFARHLRAIARDAIVAPPAIIDGLVWEHLVRTVGGDPARSLEHRETIRIPPTVVDRGRDALIAAGWDGARPLLVVHAGAGGAAKRWPVDGFVEVITAFAKTHSATVVVHEGPADRDAVRALRDRLSVSTLFLDNPSLTVLAGALGHAALYLGNDSGVSHLAACVGAPSVLLFTAATLPWRPWASAPECVVVSTTEVAENDRKRVSAALDRTWRES